MPSGVYKHKSRTAADESRFPNIKYSVYEKMTIDRSNCQTCLGSTSCCKHKDAAYSVVTLVCVCGRGCRLPEPDGEHDAKKPKKAGPGAGPKIQKARRGGRGK
ncbi:MAG: hypothetical protein MPK62_01655 [Alphaproteobacteria bacterium]|nr:hypothetical protein [Alphaproteobacteria bacterium]